MEAKDYGLRFRYLLRPRTTTSQIIVHHAASAGDVDAPTIHRWHLGNGWSGIGYHYVVRLDGALERGRPEDRIGAHAKDNNHNSIGVCLAGNIDERPPTDAQMATLLALVRDIWSRYGQIAVVGHGDVNSTVCPGRFFPWAWLREELAKPAPLPEIQQRVSVRFESEPPREGYLIDGTTFAPVRWLAEQLGARVEWQDGTAKIFKEG